MFVYGVLKSYPTEIDSDFDNLHDSEEYAYGTNPLVLDTDGDGITDGSEVRMWYDPLNANYDNDHMNDWEELRNGTNPYAYDKNGWESTGDFILGYVVGDFVQDTDSVPFLIGQISSGVTPYVGVVADIRDVIGNGAYGEWGFAVLSLAGLAPVVGDVAKSVSKTAKVVLKNIDNVPFVVDVIKNAAKVHPEVAKALSKNDDIIKSTDKILKNPQKLTKADYDFLISTSKLIDDELWSLYKSQALLRGHTGRFIPNSLKEQLAIKSVLSDPLTNAVDLSNKVVMSDKRWHASAGWIKMSKNINGYEIHFVYNKITGHFDDFKFK